MAKNKKKKYFDEEPESPYLTYSSINEEIRQDLIDAILTEKPILEMMANYNIDFDTLMFVGLILEDMKTLTWKKIGEL
jgi:hypothetical protein